MSHIFSRQIFEQTRELQYLSCCMDPIAEQHTLNVVECMSDTQYEGRGNKNVEKRETVKMQ